MGSQVFLQDMVCCQKGSWWYLVSHLQYHADEWTQRMGRFSSTSSNRWKCIRSVWPHFFLLGKEYLKAIHCLKPSRIPSLPVSTASAEMKQIPQTEKMFAFPRNPEAKPMAPPWHPSKDGSDGMVGRRLNQEGEKWLTELAQDPEIFRNFFRTQIQLHPKEKLSKNLDPNRLPSMCRSGHHPQWFLEKSPPSKTELLHSRMGWSRRSDYDFLNDLHSGGSKFGIESMPIRCTRTQLMNLGLKSNCWKREKKEK